MVYTEVASRDAKNGVIIISETLEELCKDLISWSQEFGQENLLPTEVYDRESQKCLGTISFKDGGLLLGPTS